MTEESLHIFHSTRGRKQKKTSIKDLYNRPKGEKKTNLPLIYEIYEVERKVITIMKYAQHEKGTHTHTHTHTTEAQMQRSVILVN